MNRLKFILFTVVLCVQGLLPYAQSNYNKLILEHRKQYKAEFLKDDHSPLKKRDLKYLDFFSPDSNFAVTANFTRIEDTVGFEILTHSNKKKHYYQYGKCTFSLHDTICVLYIYQSKDLMQKEELKDYLFMPFNDLSNYVSTYGGGRYLDFRMSDIQNNSLLIDFNKCYNPYCMYAGGYNCPIPPDENKLEVYIAAGEKLYLKPAAH